MRILAVNQFYHPDHAATSQLLTQLCEDLAAAGDDVTVIASPGSYLGGGRLPAREQVRGVEVLRPFATSFGKASVPRRLADYLSFWASAVATAATRTRPDVLLALTTPPMIAAGAAVVARARGVPLMTWVQDVYPEVAVAFGVLTPRHPATSVLEAMNRATHRNAARSVVLSERMRERLVAQGQRSDKVEVIQNWADGRALSASDDEISRMRRELGFEGQVVAMYSGNIGQGHDVETLIGAARSLAESHPELLMVFVGEGARKAEAERLAEGLPNVRFFPYQPYERLAASLASADVHLASLREGLDGLLVPSKLYGVLAVGRPLLYIGPARCELTRVIDEHDVGWSGRPGDVEGLARSLCTLAEHPDKRVEMGKRARELFQNEYDRPHALRRWRAALRRAAEE